MGAGASAGAADERAKGNEAFAAGDYATAAAAYSVIIERDDGVRQAEIARTLELCALCAGRRREPAGTRRRRLPYVPPEVRKTHHAADRVSVGVSLQTE